MCGFAHRKYTWMAGRYLPLLLSALFLGTWSSVSPRILLSLPFGAGIIGTHCHTFSFSFFFLSKWVLASLNSVFYAREADTFPNRHLPSLILRSFASVTDADGRSISNWTIRNLRSADIPNVLGVDTMLMFPIVKPFRF